MNKLREESTVRQNLMNEAGYAPYCGSENCNAGMPRTKWNEGLNQFACSCGWVSEFPADFIERYLPVRLAYQSNQLNKEG